MKKLLLFLSFLLFFPAVPVIAGTAPTISKEELKAQLGSENLVLLDVRSGRDWSSSEFKITGAIRSPGSDFATWSKLYPKDKTIVLYCA